MAEVWRLNIKGITGDLIAVDVPNPQVNAVIDFT